MRNKKQGSNKVFHTAVTKMFVEMFINHFWDYYDEM